jgi:uncharacterized protein (DUF3084 family)
LRAKEALALKDLELTKAYQTVSEERAAVTRLKSDLSSVNFKLDDLRAEVVSLRRELAAMAAARAMAEGVAEELRAEAEAVRSAMEASKDFSSFSAAEKIKEVVLVPALSPPVPIF